MIDRRLPSDRRTRSDRRDSPRVPLTTSLRFLRAGADAEEVLEGALLDVSTTGVRLLLERPLEPAERILIELRDDDQGCLNLPAQVVWRESSGERHHVGCELRLEMTRKQQALLRKFVSAPRPGV